MSRPDPDGLDAFETLVQTREQRHADTGARFLERLDAELAAMAARQAAPLPDCGPDRS
jgi:hypothetical protein